MNPHDFVSKGAPAYSGWNCAVCGQGAAALIHENRILNDLEKVYSFCFATGGAAYLHRDANGHRHWEPFEECAFECEIVALAVRR